MDGVAFDVILKMKQLISALVITAFTLFSQANENKQELPDYALPVLQNWLTYSPEVVEVCVFREEWIAPTKDFPKGKLLEYGTITHVHKGNVTVGERVIMTTYIEYSRENWQREAKLRPSRVSMVDGEIVFRMFDKKDSTIKDGYYDIGSSICHFTFNSEFHQAFIMEKERDPKLMGIKN